MGRERSLDFHSCNMKMQERSTASSVPAIGMTGHGGGWLQWPHQAQPVHLSTNVRAQWPSFGQYAKHSIEKTSAMLSDFSRNSFWVPRVQKASPVTF